MNVLVALCCPGSAEGLVSVIRLLVEEGHKVDVISVGSKGEGGGNGKFFGSFEVFDKFNIPCMDLLSLIDAGYIEDIPSVFIEQIIKDYHPEVILVGTSRDPSGAFKGIEEGLIIAGGISGIPVIQFVDSWEAWYPRKFSGCSATSYVVPDIITQKILGVRGGIPVDKIKITGNPAWENFLLKKTVDRDKIRKRLGLSYDNRLFVYFSGVTPDDPTTLYWVLKNLTPSDRLIFCRHPRDSRDYDRIIQDYRKAIIFTDMDSDILLQCADICLTHYGAMGVKAALSGITTINFILYGDCDQLCHESGGFPLSVLKGSYQVGSESEYRNILDNIAPPEIADLKMKLCLDGKAAQRIVKALKSAAFKGVTE